MVRRTKEALFWIIKILKKHNIHYQITGGFAAKIYGSKRSLADIDIEIHDRDMKKVLPHVKNYILKGPLRHKDKQFNTYGLFLRYKNQRIDVCGSDTQKLFNKKFSKWEKEKINLKKAIRKKVYGIPVKVVSLKNLIDYKKRISRKVDRIDVKNLTKIISTQPALLFFLWL